MVSLVSESAPRGRDERPQTSTTTPHGPHASPSNLNVILLTRALNFGGTERQLVHLAKGLAERGHRVSVVTFYPGTAFDQEFDQSNPTLHVLGKRGRWDIAGFMLRLLRLCRALSPDVIYAPLPVPSLVAVLVRTLACRHAGVVCGVRGTPLDLTRYDWLERLANRVQRHVHQASDLVIANANSCADWLRGTGIAESRIAVVANGIDAASIRPASSAERGLARELLGCDPAAIVIAVVGRLDPMKGHDVFLQAFSEAASEEPNLQALIVGDGPEDFAARLREQAASQTAMGRVVWVAAQRDVVSVYHAADLLCLPSVFGEGFSNVLGEAMAAGLPCVASAVGDNAAILGSSGRVVPPGDASALAQAILDVARAQRQKTCDGWALRRRVLDAFSIERMVTETEKLLTEVARNRAPGNV